MLCCSCAELNLAWVLFSILGNIYVLLDMDATGRRERGGGYPSVWFLLLSWRALLSQFVLSKEALGLVVQWSWIYKKIVVPSVFDRRWLFRQDDEQRNTSQPQQHMPW